MDLDDADRSAVLGAVREFARAEIGPLVERPEHTPARTDIDAVLAALADLGVLTAGGEPALGVWDDLTQASACQLSADLLGELAAVSPGVAYEVHLRGLAAALDRSAGGFEPDSVVTFEAGSGVSGRLTGRALLEGEGLTENDIAELADAWGTPTTRPRLYVGPPEWTQLWWPLWTSGQGWLMCRTPRAGVASEPSPNGHGLDEIGYARCTLTDGDVASDRATLVDAFACHAIGLLAISTATARRSIDRARAFSLTRHQGGVPIGRHDAVAQLLASAGHAVATSAALLVQVTTPPGGLSRLHRAWRARALCQPLLTAAGSDALQVLGGVGYMRDIGAEKDQRDLNTLRRLGGSPAELTLRCAALDETAGRAA